MIPLDITANIEESPWTECAGVLAGGDLSTIEKMGLLPRGTALGQPVVMIKMVTPTGQVVVGQTSWKLFRAAARALEGAVGFHGMMDGVDDR